ncbi:Uncharacterised protein [Vibrio cholerae]|uniref:Uncharacterized protein n=1 Tax=Vibrio cholerae TaxID=666 RepID=A0A655QHU1_VIBCL|nr:Uncharacterised protein [Vibrio cholerae]CSC39194.1 Uncharacterised protein [Vibrio cholerae]
MVIWKRPWFESSAVGVRVNTSPFSSTWYASQSLALLRVSSTKGVCSKASSARYKVTCSTKGSKCHKVVPSETSKFSSGVSVSQRNRLGRAISTLPFPVRITLPSGLNTC